MRLLLALPLLLAACAPSREIPGTSFDAAAWVDRAIALSDTAPEMMDYDDPLATPARALADTLDAAVGWKRACDTYWDAEANREVYEPVEDGGGHFGRGLYEIHDVGPGEYVVEVTCNFGAYQGAYALVHVEGSRATLLRAQDYDADGAPYGPPSGVFGTPSFTPESRTFHTFAKSRGMGDCGQFARYRLGRGGVVETVEVRARGCDEEIPDELPPPQEWPVVYPRR